MKRIQPFTEAEFKNIYSKVTRLCVDLLILQDNRFLLTLRKSHGWVNQWHFPGGTVLFRESISDAIQRIAQEELGSQVVVDRYLGHTEFFTEQKERGYGYSISLVHVCHLPPNSPISPDNQSDEYRFFSSLPSNTIKEHKDFILSNFPNLTVTDQVL